MISKKYHIFLKEFIQDLPFDVGNSVIIPTVRWIRPAFKFNNIKFFLKELPFSPIVLPIIIIVRLIKPIFHIRFGTFYIGAIGHFALDAGIYFSEKSKVVKKTYDFFWLPPINESANNFFYKQVKRNLNVSKFVFHLDYYNRLFPGNETHIAAPIRNIKRAKSRDLDGFLNTRKNIIPFKQHEEEQAENWMRNKGWNGEPIVGLQVRDDAYWRMTTHSKYYPDSTGELMAHRNVNIEDFRETVEYLLSNGFWVVRMGKFANNKVSIKHKAFIDYPFCDDQIDLVDIWIPAKCKFFISTSTGVDALAIINKKPIVYTNFIPLLLFCSFTPCVTIFSHLYWNDTGKELSITEMLENTYYYKNNYDEAGIYIKNNTPKEILDAVKEMIFILESRGVKNFDDSPLQKLFYRILKNHRNYTWAHKILHPNAKVGKDYITNYYENNLLI